MMKCITRIATRKTDSVYVAQCNIYSVMRKNFNWFDTPPIAVFFCS